MFSNRSALASGDNAWSQIVTAARHQRPDLLDLTTSNPTAIDLPAPWSEVQAILQRHAVVQYQPEPFGLPVARAAIAAYYNNHVEPSQIVIAASTSEAYGWLFQLLCEPGEEILIPTPSYPLFDCLAQLQGVVTLAVPWQYAAGTWWLDRDTLRSQVTLGTRAVVVVSPNNPTGAVLQHTDAEFLQDLCADNDLALIVDEVFADFVPQWPADALGTATRLSRCLTFVLSGLSKVALLPHLKLGWLVVAGPPALRDAALRRLEFIADACLSVATPIQHALPELLELAPAMRAPLIERLQVNRTVLKQSLRDTPATLLPADGGWLAIVQLPETEDDGGNSAVRLLQLHGVLVQPGWLYDLPLGESWVVSLLPPPALFASAANRMRRWLAG